MAQIIRELTEAELLFEGRALGVSLPGDILSDLAAHAAVGDFEKGDDYEKIQWVQDRDWTYRIRIALTDAEAQCEEQTLVFRGIDTYADIYLNGEFLLHTEDMFLQYSADCAGRLRAGENVLEIKMRSPTAALKARKNEKYICIFNRDRIFHRKAQCHFGWDWAPEIAGYGVYEPIELHLGDRFHINDVFVKTKISGELVFLTELAYNVRKCENSAYRGDELEVTVFERGGKVALKKRCAVDGAVNLLAATIQEPRLWYPNGYGEAALYDYTVRLWRKGAVLDEKSGYFGIRAVALEEHPYKEENRLTLRLNVNGVPVYAKGSNWVPLDFRTGAIKKEQYEKSIRLAGDAGMNMLRVWGGGIFEKEDFYRACDENGIMVMQEFMISCSDIPAEEKEIVDLLLEESVYQVKRLRNHPAIVLWSGGNERSQAFNLCEAGTGYFESDVVLRGIVGKYADNVPYVDHSPWSYTDVHDDVSSGDVHNSCLDKTIETYETGRYRDYINLRLPAFVSECATLGPCRIASLRKFMKEEELWPLNEVWKKRLRNNPCSPDTPYFSEWIRRMDELLFSDPQSLSDYVKYGCTAQAEILYDEVMYLRLNREVNGGFLNWMYGDIWGTATWSLVDHYLEPKAGYYGMKRAFRPLAVAFTLDYDKKFKVGAVNDTGKTVSGAITYGAMDASGKVLYRNVSEVVTLKSGESVRIPVEMPVENAVWFAGFAGESAIWFPDYWKKFSFESKFTYKTEEAGGSLALTIRAQSLLKTVYLEVPCGAVPTDNYFDMLPAQEKTVYIGYLSGIKAEDIKIKTLADDFES